jgi:hypothetical protein
MTAILERSTLKSDARRVDLSANTLVSLGH